MELIKCASCNKGLSYDADSCPHCASKKPFKGYVLSPIEQKGMTYKERKSFIKAGGKLKSSFFTKVVLSICFLIILVFILTPKKPVSPERQAEIIKKERERGARHACQYQLEQRLHVKSSVEYLNKLLDRIVIDQSNNNWFVQLNFRAKNKFGVLLENQVKCQVVEKNGKFVVVNLQVNK